LSLSGIVLSTFEERKSGSAKQDFSQTHVTFVDDVDDDNDDDSIDVRNMSVTSYIVQHSKRKK